MAIQTKIVVRKDTINNSTYASALVVNLQEMDFDAFCEYLAQDSTVGAADVAAVMKQLEKKLPLILGMGTKVQISAGGIVVKPTVSGSLTQKQLTEKLTARKAELTRAGKTEEAAKVDTTRELTAADLTVNDLTAGISIDFSKKFNADFASNATFKRVNSGKEEDEEGTANGTTPGTGTNTGTNTGAGSDKGIED